MNLTKLYYRLLYHITKKQKLKKLYKETWGINNKLVIVDEKGLKKEVPLNYDIKIKWLDIHWKGSNNTITIEMPVDNLRKLEIFIKSDNNHVHIGKYLRGSFTLWLHNGDNIVTFGNRISARSMTVTLNSGSLTVGNNCLFSDFINILTDGHSVIDKTTRELINKNRADIQIGNHVWIGFGATLLKNSYIGNDCIVANSAVVTKPFKENNVIIAGNPAKIVKRNINWNNTAPIEYSKENADFSF